MVAISTSTIATAALGVDMHDHFVRRMLDKVRPKTQFRVVMTPQPRDVSDFDNSGDGSSMIDLRTGKSIPCPFGELRDRVWIREAFRTWNENHCHVHEERDEDEGCSDSCRQTYVAYRATPRRGFRPVPDRQEITYLDDASPLHLNKRLATGKWNDASSMPHDFARIELELADVRIERLHEISDDDAFAEGVTIDASGLFGGAPLPFTDPLIQGYRRQRPGLDEPEPGAFVRYFHSPREAFQDLWLVAYGRNDWMANPWVWAATFNRLRTRPV